MASLSEISYKEQVYDFHYDDEDNVVNEINEFFAYVETTQTEENLKCWEGSFQGGKEAFCSNITRKHIFE